MFNIDTFGLDDCENHLNKFYCNAWVASAIVGSALVGAASTAYSANKASKAQTNAANNAAAISLETARLNRQTTLDMYNTTRGDLAPFRNMGVNAGNELQNRLSELTSPIDLPTLPDNELPTLPGKMTQAELEATPGYQFTLSQGLKSVQNSAAARGLGTSGAALKGAAAFATGLSDQTYNTRFQQEQELFKNRQQQFTNKQTLFQNRQQQFTNQQLNRSNAFNRLKSLIDTGENAAAQTGTFASNAANTAANASTAGAQGASNAFIGAGNAQAAGINALGGAINTATNQIGAYGLYRGMFPEGSSGANTWLGSPQWANPANPTGTGVW